MASGVYFSYFLFREVKENFFSSEKEKTAQEEPQKTEEEILIPEGLSPEEQEKMRKDIEKMKQETERIEKENKEPLKEIENGFVGSFEVTGYIERKKVPCEPQGMCQGELEYIAFVPKKAKEDAVERFLEKNTSLGIGCYLEQQKGIFSQNYGDGGAVENQITGETLEKLLASSEGDLLTIKLTKPKLTWEGIRPSCYSDFRNVELAQ